MAEEFQESDIIFSDNNRRRDFPYGESDDGDCSRRHNSRATRTAKSKILSENKMIANSLPVNIPDTIFRSVDSGDNSEEDEEMVPPHVIVGRRIAGKMAFSVCTGNGRTLKGRDLSRVRNSILRMTGFLEA
ncbi:hypothetical protein L6164_031781 [Bauhinia variegata]|uniref:Uncharacterized protein n=1 Tax=Bauhinia variegata TaxID=167791 RepID=A0ACB9KLP3_BAUVA|nr:hypothetical protein L6164_031781 [Bauhinia variegata]